MKTTTIAAVVSLAGMGLFSATAAADAMAPQDKVDACVAAIEANADYSDGTRVRHEVLSQEYRRLGHKLYIDTKVYGSAGGEAIREYSAVCVVTSGPEPARFRIEETKTRS